MSLKYFSAFLQTVNLLFREIDYYDNYVSIRTINKTDINNTFSPKCESK